MGILNWIFRKRDTAGQSRHFFFKSKDNATAIGNSDLIKGLIFSATLQIRTPLVVLEHHGESFDGLPSQTPSYGTEADGIWLYSVKSWAELGAKAPDSKEEEKTYASDIGYTKASEYLPFLKDFRKIVESDKSISEKLKLLSILSKSSPHNKEIWLKLKRYYEDFPRSFFYKELTAIPGIGMKTAKNLFDAGFKTASDIDTATDDELLKVSGIGKTLHSKIRKNLKTTQT